MSRLEGRSATRAVRAGLCSDTAFGAVMPPIHLSSNFVFEAPGVCGPYDYTRSGNPTRTLLADALAELEHGAGAVVTSSGMAALNVVAHLLRAGDVVVAPHDCYGGTHRLLTAEARRIGFELHFVDQPRSNPSELLSALRPKLLLLETPSNPLLRITDISDWCEAAHEVGAICVVDNTFLSPANQRPLDWGADAVVHSTTKFLNGHSDVVGGAVVAADPELLDTIAWWTNCLGAAGAPFDSFLTLRGMRTLSARVRVHEENTSRIVDVIAASDVVGATHHPSLESHPGHDIARRQQSGWGSLVSFDLHGGRVAVEAFAAALELFTLAESLGGVESLVAHPATMTHASMDAGARRTAGIGDGLVRLSVGIEDPQDLVDDLGRALKCAEEVACRVV